MFELQLYKFTSFIFMFLFILNYLRVSEHTYINKLKKELKTEEQLKWLQVHINRIDKMTWLARFAYWFIMRGGNND